MIDFLKRHKISLALLILGLTIGLFQFMKESAIDMWLIEYEFDSAVESEIKDIERADTVFQYKNIVCRNFVSSIGDTIQKKGIRRHELKIYLPQDLKISKTELSEEILSLPFTRIVKYQFRETQKNKQKILYWTLFGLFLGMFLVVSRDVSCGRDATVPWSGTRVERARLLNRRPRRHARLVAPPFT